MSDVGEQSLPNLNDTSSNTSFEDEKKIYTSSKKIINIQKKNVVDDQKTTILKPIKSATKQKPGKPDKSLDFYKRCAKILGMHISNAWFKNCKSEELKALILHDKLAETGIPGKVNFQNCQKFKKFYHLNKELCDLKENHTDNIITSTRSTRSGKNISPYLQEN